MSYWTGGYTAAGRRSISKRHIASALGGPAPNNPGVPQPNNPINPTPRDDGGIGITRPSPQPIAPFDPNEGFGGLRSPTAPQPLMPSPIVNSGNPGPGSFGLGQQANSTPQNANPQPQVMSAPGFPTPQNEIVSGYQPNPEVNPMTTPEISGTPGYQIPTPEPNPFAMPIAMGGGLTGLPSGGDSPLATFGWGAPKPKRMGIG